MPDRILYTFAMNQQKFKASVRTQKHRLTVTEKNKYQLTNLLEDPEEQKDITTEFPEIAKTFYDNYLKKYEEITQNLSEIRPISVGYSESPKVVLHAHEGFFTGDIAYETAHWGWCNDWFTNWTSEQDTMFWHLDVVAEGQYKAQLEYTAPKASIGTKLTISANDQLLTWKIDEAFTPQFVEDFEQYPRKVEADEQTWKIKEIGQIALNKGQQKIKLSASEIKGKSIGEVKSIRLIKMDSL